LVGRYDPGRYRDYRDSDSTYLGEEGLEGSLSLRVYSIRSLFYSEMHLS